MHYVDTQGEKETPYVNIIPVSYLNKLKTTFNNLSVFASGVYEKIADMVQGM